MVDHKAMQDALDRALTDVHNNYCNQCKSHFTENQGGYIKLVATEKIYQIWYCDQCFHFEN